MTTAEKYAVTATRQSAALFFAWEFGTSRAIKKMADIKHGFGAIKHFRTMREARSFQEHMKIVVNWQRGRLGLPINDGGIFVKDHPYKPLTEA